MKTPIIAVLAIVATALFATQIADAHTAQISINCNAVTFSYSSFPQGVSVAAYSVRVDGSTVSSGNFNITGPADSKVISINLSGNHFVSADTSWTADGGGSASASQDVQCGSSPPPPKQCPPGTHPGGQDGQPGNDSSCVPDSPPPVIVPPTCPDGTTQIGTNPLVCQKVVTECGKGATLVNGECTTPPKVIYKWKYKTKIVYRYHTKIVYKWKTKIKKVCHCPKGYHLTPSGKCAPEAQG